MLHATVAHCGRDVIVTSCLMFQVAYAAKDLRANVVVDMATLTGAQGVATGLYHAAVVTNNEDWEKASVSAGKSSGDLVVMHVALCVYFIAATCQYLLLSYNQFI